MRRVQVGDVTVEDSSNGITLRIGAAGDLWSPNRRELIVPRTEEHDLLLAINAYFGRKPARSEQ